jgi:hypothetical protein
MNGAVLKYNNVTHAQPNCPPDTTSERNYTAYRYVHSPITSNNFIPVAISSPSRNFGPGVPCSAFGLSLWASEQQAMEKYEKLKRSCKMIRESIGTHLARGDISSSDGLSSEVSKSGHIDLFEYSTCNLESRFTITRAL